MAEDYTDPTQEAIEEIAERKQIAVDPSGFPRRIHGPAPNYIGTLLPNERVIFYSPPHLGFVLCFEDARIFGEARYEVMAAEQIELTVQEDAPKGPFSFKTITAKDSELEHESCECDNVVRALALHTEGGGGLGGGEVGGP